MDKTTRYSPEVRARAVRLVQEHAAEYPSGSMKWSGRTEEPPMNDAVFRGLAGLLLAGACAGTAPTTPSPDRCPEVPGEFRPTDCALVRGVAKNRTGQTLANLPVMVDSAVRLIGYAYASSATLTNTDGSFELTVFRINRLVPIRVPDTATVEIKAYTGPDPRAGDIPVARALVRLHFAELGKSVPPSVVEAIFGLP